MPAAGEQPARTRVSCADLEEDDVEVSWQWRLIMSRHLKGPTACVRRSGVEFTMRFRIACLSA